MRLRYKGQIVDVNDSDRVLIDYYLGDGATDETVNRAEVDEFVAHATVDQVLDRVAEAPHLAADVLAAEQRKDHPRVTLVDALTAQSEPATAGEVPVEDPGA